MNTTINQTIINLCKSGKTKLSYDEVYKRIAEYSTANQLSYTELRKFITGNYSGFFELINP